MGGGMELEEGRARRRADAQEEEPRLPLLASPSILFPQRFFDCLFISGIKFEDFGTSKFIHDASKMPKSSQKIYFFDFLPQTHAPHRVRRAQNLSRN